MNVASLIGELEKHGVKIEECLLKNGELTVSHLAISRRPFGTEWPGGKWCVYFSYSNVAFDVHVLDNESAACEKFLARTLLGIELKHKYGRMTGPDLITELAQHKISPAWYSLEGAKYTGDELVLSQDYEGHWTVFKAERGTRQNAITFGSESEACIHFLDRIIAYAEVLRST